VSVSSAAVDYVRQVFSRFDDKTVLVIGAGKMGELTLKHLRELQPRRLWLTNRSPDKAVAMAQECGGTAVPWEDLDAALARADIVLSTTGAPEVIVTQARWQAIQARRSGGAVVILDIAVPRDFDPAIHDGDATCLFNIDDLKRIRAQTLADRAKHIAPAEAIVAEEQKRFLKQWQKRQHAPLIARLTQELEARRLDRVKHLFAKLDGRLTDKDRSLVESEFRQQQNEFLHVVISALHEESQHGLLEAIRKFFRLE
jgi:glutamyl-tRNA reductase